MTKIYNPLYDGLPAADDKDLEVSTSSLTNDTIGVCPKCSQPFGSGIVDNSTVYYCDRCRVCQPMPA